jgi:hypothetical protein
VSESALAFSPSAPVLAYCRARRAPGPNFDSRWELALFDYERRTDVAVLPIPFAPHVIRFSPSGNSVVVKPGGEYWNDVIVFSHPWAAPRLETKILVGHHDMCFLDEETLLIAGCSAFGVTAVALLDLATG